MTIVVVKPVSAGRRSLVKSVCSYLHKGRPLKSLARSQFRKGGRNSQGRLTVRHQGGGHKQYYRIVDFFRKKDHQLARVERIEYDPNRNAHIALICYLDGERRYVIAPKGLCPGMEISNGPESPIKLGNCLPLANIPAGTSVHCIEMLPGKGAQIARSAGSSAVLLVVEGNYAQVRLRSGEIRRIHACCRATIGVVSNEEHNLCQLGKAGASRWRGIRPTVRGEAMNPVDHPMGGRTRGNRHPTSPWGQLAKGFKTRRNKRTDGMVLQSRSKR